jgi:hypothetical protein
MTRNFWRYCHRAWMLGHPPCTLRSPGLHLAIPQAIVRLQEALASGLAERMQNIGQDS